MRNSVLVKLRFVAGFLLIVLARHGMAIEMTESAPIGGSEDVQNFETFVGSKLPRDYKEFLVKHNGGSPQQPNEVKGHSGASVRSFLGINGESGRDLYKVLENYSGRIPKNTIPIAEDGCGNLLVMSLEKANYGSVYFWDHELEVEEEDEVIDNPPNITRLANNFSEFFEKMQIISSENIVVTQEEKDAAWIDPEFLKQHRE